jgi:hypothetical protein
VVGNARKDVRKEARTEEGDRMAGKDPILDIFVDNP